MKVEIDLPDHIVALARGIVAYNQVAFGPDREPQWDSLEAWMRAAIIEDLNVWCEAMGHNYEIGLPTLLGKRLRDAPASKVEENP